MNSAWPRRNNDGPTAAAWKIAVAQMLLLREAVVDREAMVMRTPDTAEAGMARINGVLIRMAIVVAIAAATVLPLLR